MAIAIKLSARTNQHVIGIASIRMRTAKVALRCRALDKSSSILGGVATTYFAFLANLPAGAEDMVDFGKGGNADPKSYFTVLALFLLSVPGKSDSRNKCRGTVALNVAIVYECYSCAEDRARGTAVLRAGLAQLSTAWPTARLKRLTCSHVPGLYSQVKRSPKAKIKRKTFEMPGPAADEPVSMDAWYVILGTGAVEAACNT